MKKISKEAIARLQAALADPVAAEDDDSDGLVDKLDMNHDVEVICFVMVGRPSHKRNRAIHEDAEKEKCPPEADPPSAEIVDREW
jgi:hypothetical protein